MWPVLQALLAIICSVARSRLSLQLEVVALRHQLSVYPMALEQYPFAAEQINAPEAVIGVPDKGKPRCFLQAEKGWRKVHGYHDLWMLHQALDWPLDDKRE